MEAVLSGMLTLHTNRTNPTRYVMTAQSSATAALKRQHPERSGETLVQPPSERAEISTNIRQAEHFSELATTCFNMFQVALTH